jgi:hypothetical protein
MIDIHAFIVSELLPSGKLYIPRRGKNMFSAGNTSPQSQSEVQYAERLDDVCIARCQCGFDA